MKSKSIESLLPDDLSQDSQWINQSINQSLLPDDLSQIPGWVPAGSQSQKLQSLKAKYPSAQEEHFRAAKFVLHWHWPLFASQLLLNDPSESHSQAGGGEWRRYDMRIKILNQGTRWSLMIITTDKENDKENGRSNGQQQQQQQQRK